jgi:hypothetical protein
MCKVQFDDRYERWRLRPAGSSVRGFETDDLGSCQKDEFDSASLAGRRRAPTSTGWLTGVCGNGGMECHE